MQAPRASRASCERQTRSKTREPEQPPCCVLRLWRDLSPFIQRERELRSPPEYQQYFEHLAVTVQQVEPARARAKLRTFGGSEPSVESADQP